MTGAPFWPLQLLAAGAAAFPIDPSQFVKPEVAMQRKACGFRHVSVKNDDTLQEEVIVVSRVRRASDFQLRCVVRQSLASSIYVQFPGSLDRKYQRLYVRIRRKADRIEARNWLQRHGLLAKLPHYERRKTDDVRFAHELED